MSDGKTINHSCNALPENSQIVYDKPDSVFDAELAKELIKRTDKLNDTTVDLAIRLKQAREFIAWSAHHCKSSWFDWLEQSNEACREMNAFRMTFDRETKCIVAQAKDIAAFFNSPEYLKAHLHVKEMLTIMDRFAQLKKDGTLDAFADFILKLTCTR